MNELEQYRQAITEIDVKLVNLFVDRFTFVKKIGEYKMKNNLSIHQWAQWERVISAIMKLAADRWLDEDFANRIWSSIHEHALELQWNKRG